ncbi:hypothetical protein CTA1_3983 [Colletotrichum tanaceti]|uniref:Uncharacterized protein n=1 Tax=Colletotrichum tanaceti TaxID=1306861 RepID=A0A4U6XGV0_9PEZI|nr:hypothetical protein CTA1_3983 [Colletotrichum tanaceti]
MLVAASQFRDSQMLLVVNVAPTHDCRQSTTHAEASGTSRRLAAAARELRRLGVVRRRARGDGLAQLGAALGGALTGVIVQPQHPCRGRGDGAS